MAKRVVVVLAVEGEVLRVPGVEIRLLETPLLLRTKTPRAPVPRRQLLT